MGTSPGSYPASSSHSVVLLLSKNSSCDEFEDEDEDGDMHRDCDNDYDDDEMMKIVVSNSSMINAMKKKNDTI